MWRNFLSGVHDRSLNLDVSQITIHFYDFSKEYYQILPISYAEGLFHINNLEKRRKFIIFVPGYKSAIHKNTEEKVREAFKTHPNSYLIIIDHSPYTNNKEGNIKSYERSVKFVYYLGKAIGEMLTLLTKKGIKPIQIHCIGHSLGSQILAHAGEVYTEKTGAKISRISALDPAGPCFSKTVIQEQIRAGVAEYVEVYHCNAGGLGTSSVLGDIDFFINKGGSQPNCGTPLMPKAAKCSHKACVTLYMDTVNNPNMYMASKCDNYKMFKDGMCSSNDVTVAGFWNPGNQTGVFYINTQWL